MSIILYIYVHICMHIARLSLSLHIYFTCGMYAWYVYMYIYYIYIYIYYIQMYQSSIGEDHSQCNIPFNHNWGCRPQTATGPSFRCRCWVWGSQFESHRDHPLTGKPWLMNLRSSTWGMAGYGLSIIHFRKRWRCMVLGIPHELLAYIILKW